MAVELWVHKLVFKLSGLIWFLIIAALGFVWAYYAPWLDTCIWLGHTWEKLTDTNLCCRNSWDLVNMLNYTQSKGRKHQNDLVKYSDEDLLTLQESTEVHWKPPSPLQDSLKDTFTEIFVSFVKDFAAATNAVGGTVSANIETQDIYKWQIWRMPNYWHLEKYRQFLMTWHFRYYFLIRYLCKPVMDIRK